MSIATAIENAQQKVANCYTSVDNMGGTLPATQNLSNLPAAIESISGGDTVTIAGSDVPYGQKVYIRFDTHREPYLTSFSNAYTYTGVSNGDGTFKIALPDPLPYLQNYVVNGSVTIADDLNGTGWGASNYLSNIVEPLQEVNLEIIGKVCFSSGTSVKVICPYAAMSSRGLFTYFDSNTSWDRATTERSISSNTFYWFRVRIINGIAIGWTLGDSGYVESTLPDIDNWTGQFVTNKNTEALAVTIGKTFGSNGTNWNERIVLSAFKIYNLDIENGTKRLTWQMYSPFNLTLSDMTKYIPSGDWYIKSGQGTPIDSPHPLGFRKGFDDFYRDSSTSLYPCAKTFRWNLSGAKSIYCKGHFKTPSSWVSNVHQPILAYTTNSYAYPVTVYRDYNSGHLTGTFGDIIPVSLATNTEYWFEATMDNQGNRTQKYSTDGENWTTTSDTVTAPTWKDYTDVPSVGYWGNGNFTWRGGIMDLECGYVDANDETHTFKLWK